MASWAQLLALAQHDLSISTSAESYNTDQELRFHFLHPRIFLKAEEFSKFS